MDEEAGSFEKALLNSWRGFRNKLPGGIGDYLDPKSAFEKVIKKNGTAVITRWSGTVHLVTRAGEVRTLSLPRQPGDLYYTAVLREGRVCATRCGGLAVVCRDAGD